MEFFSEFFGFILLACLLHATNRILLACFDYLLNFVAILVVLWSFSFLQVEYNLYGMGFLHLSKMRFRHPVPNVYLPRKSIYNGQDGHDMDLETCMSADIQVNISPSLIHTRCFLSDISSIFFFN